MIAWARACVVRWWGRKRRIDELEHEIGLFRERVAHLEEMIAAYRDTLETHHRETQVRTAIAISERESLRRVEGGRA